MRDYEEASRALSLFLQVMKGDIEMANYKKRDKQEAAYPIPISLYNCYRTVRHEKRGIATPSLLLIAFLMPHCPVTVVQRYRDVVCSLLSHSFFHNLPSLYPPSLICCANAISRCKKEI